MSRVQLRVLLLLSLVWFGASVQVNAPSLLVGYGVVTFAIVLTLLFCRPACTFVVTLLGQLLALPLIYYSRSMFLIVAVLGALVRPPVAAFSSYLRRYGDALGALFYGAMSALLTLLIAVLYYGDNGIHAGLAVFDLVPAGIAYASYYMYMRNPRLGLLVGFMGVILIVSLLFYWSWTAPFIVLALAALFFPARVGVSERLGVALVLLVVGLAVGHAGLSRNLDIMMYPFKPASFGDDRWHGQCVGFNGDLFRDVYDPERLRIVDTCVVVEGVISEIPSVAGDGDYCFDVKITSSNVTSPLSIGSHVLRKSTLHSEIVPNHTMLLEALGGKLCRGDRVVITGPLVVDTDHGQWAEIHPVLSVEVIERGEGPCIALEGAP